VRKRGWCSVGVQYVNPSLAVGIDQVIEHSNHRRAADTRRDQEERLAAVTLYEVVEWRCEGRLITPEEIVIEEV
jgi:hypothetical protein